MNITNLLFLLTPKNDVVFLYQDCTVRQAIEKMNTHRFSVIPVIEKNSGRFLRTLSEGDLLNYIAKNHMDFNALEDVSICAVPSYRAYEPASISAQPRDILGVIMNQNFVPLTDDHGVFIGIVTRHAVMTNLLRYIDTDSK